MAMPDIRFEEMSDRALVEVFKALVAVEEEERENALAKLLETAILIEAKKGRGKTLTALALAWELRERFGRGVVCVGSKMSLNEKFGPYQFMSEADFRSEMEKITVAASEEDSAERVANMFDKYGISILYKTVVFDEAYKLFNARTPMDKLVQLTGFFVAQQRHYHVTTIFTSPTREMIDKRVRAQLDWQGRVYHNKYTHIARCRLVSGIDVVTYEVDGASDAEHVPFYDMYDSWGMLGFRRQQLAIKNM
jgi:Cdc6-like AAA superfamily ATPase